MNSDTPTVDQLRAMLALHEERAKVQRQLNAIDEKLAALQSRIFPGGALRRGARSAVERSPRKSGEPDAVRTERAAKATGPAPAKAPRNEFKGRVTAALTAAGDTGASLKELAERLGINYRNVAVWFATTGKKNPQIVKVGPARYRLATRAPAARGLSSVDAESASSSAPAPGDTALEPPAAA